MKLWNRELPQLVFHLELGDKKTLPVSLPIPAQPLSHFAPQLLKSIGDELSKLRKQSRKGEIK